ncbi:hypothetical protein F5Y19DRAFT_474763 [Xylariaceae sp. FL1651]|nr:hypothetical protein F5Y19DRAFT_474763 [Xylariaceae sp. FL1651]
MDPLSTLFRPHPGHGIKPTNWASILDSEVTGIWVILRNSIPGSPAPYAKGWAICLPTKNGQVATLYPEASSTKSDSSIVIVVEPLLSDKDVSPRDAINNIIELSTNRFRRDVMAKTTTRMILDTILASGIQNYTLQDSRGLRYWICLALFTIRDHVAEWRIWESISERALSELRRTLYNETYQCFTVRLTAGNLLLHKLSTNGLKAWNDCRDTREKVANSGKAVDTEAF